MLYTVEFRHTSSISTGKIVTLVCAREDLFDILYMLDRYDGIMDYKVSCGADTHLTKTTLGYPVDKLVTVFKWSENDFSN